MVWYSIVHAHRVSEGDTSESRTPPDIDVSRILAAHGGQYQSAVTVAVLLDEFKEEEEILARCLMAGIREEQELGAEGGGKVELDGNGWRSREVLTERDE